MAKIKLTDYIAKRLQERYNVDRVFFISGGGAMHLNDSLGKYLRYTTSHNEQALAMIAEGYAKVSNKLSVVNPTSGPGGLNCMNGVFGQWTDSVPVLYLSGQVKFSTTIKSCENIGLRQLGDQEVDIISCVKPITKYSVMVTDPKTIKYHLDRAIYEATTGKHGPVWLDIPLNVQSSIIDEDDLTDFVAPVDTDYELKVAEVINLIKESKKPLIIAGRGNRIAKTTDLLRSLLEMTKIPVVTTFNGFDVVEDSNPNYIGRIGTLGQRAGNFVLQNADVILCLGTRNHIRQVSYNYENYAKNAKLIVVDIDNAELEKPTVNPTIKINADLKDFMPKFVEEIKNIEFNIAPNWLEWCLDIKKKYSYTIRETVNLEPLDPYDFSYILSKRLPEGSTVVMSNGSACVCPYQASIVKKNQRYIMNSGCASMGYGLPAAIGASQMLNDSEVICLEGDGSIMMNLQELQTVKHYGLPIKVFVINNEGYISIKQTQTNFFDGRLTGADKSSGVSTPDFSKIANAFDLKYSLIDSYNEIEVRIDDVLNSTEAVFCEVKVNPNYIFSPKLSAKKLDDGTMISPSLEDMYPFLEKEELERNIYNEIH